MTVTEAALFSSASARRRLAAAALALLLPPFSGCHFAISPEVTFRTAEGELAPAPARPAPAPKRNELVAGLLPVAVEYADPSRPDEEAGRAAEIGRALQEALDDARIFKEVRYPLRDETVDVVLEAKAEVRLSKNRFTNAIKVFPGIVFPWIDGFGLDYDHRVALALAVKTPAGELCDGRRAESALTAERYPSVLWLLGIHVGLLVLMVHESATTDHLVRERLIARNVGRAIEEQAAWLAREFTPEAKACPVHPDAPRGGKFCVYCGRNLWYPILNRRAGRDVSAPAEPGLRGAAGADAPRAATTTAR